MQRKHTRKFVIVWATLLLLWVVIGGAVQVHLSMLDRIENNAVSHVVAEMTDEYEWLPLAVGGFWGLLSIFGVLCIWHWWSVGHFSLWPRAVWKEEIPTCNCGKPKAYVWRPDQKKYSWISDCDMCSVSLSEIEDLRKHRAEIAGSE